MCVQIGQINGILDLLIWTILFSRLRYDPKNDDIK